MFVKRIGNVFKHPNQIVSTDYKCFIAFAPPLISACVVDVASRDLLSLSCLSILKFVRCKNPFPFVSANLSQKTGLTYTHTLSLSHTHALSLSLSHTHTHTNTHFHSHTHSLSCFVYLARCCIEIWSRPIQCARRRRRRARQDLGPRH